MMAAMAGMAEVEHGKLAAQKAASSKVKAFGQKMVTEHTKANNDLKGVAATKQLTLPTSMGPEHQAMQDKLAGISGAEFDRA